jgi:S-adenosylmethionine-dependent methyltransferase
MRTFWDLQQNQDIQKDKTWQEQMLQMELKVSELEEYKDIASFHHVILRKK